MFRRSFVLATILILGMVAYANASVWDPFTLHAGDSIRIICPTRIVVKFSPNRQQANNICLVNTHGR